MKFTLKSVGALACAAMLSVSLTGCGSGGEANSNSGGDGGIKVEMKQVDYTKASYDELKDGGELRLPITELTAQGNIFHQDGSSYTREMWTWYNPQMILFDDNWEPYPNPEYLTNVKVEEKDGKTVVTYDINEKATFNDGTPIDWTAFETAWKINNGKSEDYMPNSTDGYQDIESVTQGTSAKQAVVTFDKPYAWVYGLFNEVAHPKLADPEFYKNGYLNQAQNDLGAGPYMVENFDPQGGVMTFVRNPKWWGKPGKLDRVTLKVLESQASLNAMKNGEIDAITELVNGIGTKERYDAVKDVPHTKIYTAGDIANSVFMLNANSEVLKDPKVREAIMCARDRQKLAEIAYNGLDYKAPMAGSYLLFPTQKGYHDNFSDVVKYDPEHAKQLLEEAGWKPGADGIREKDGKRLEIRYPLFGDSATKKAGATALQQMMKEVGVDFKIDPKPSKEFSKVFTNRDFDIMSLGFKSSDPFGVAYFGQIYASDSGLNLSGTGTPEMDAKIKELQKIADPDKQIEAANKLEQEAFKSFGIMPGVVDPIMTICNEKLANVGSTTLCKHPKEEIGWLK